MLVKSVKRRGNVVVLVAVCLTTLLSIVAIAVDGGMLLDNRRNTQAGADAALAAADDLFSNYLSRNGVDSAGTARASALATAAANGYLNDGATSVVTVRLAPENYLYGPNAGTPVPAGYAEVTIDFNQKRGFSAIFGSGDLPVRARAVARGKWTTYNNGILVLDPTSRGALTGSGNGSVTVLHAAVIVNSNDLSGGELNGGGSLSAPAIDFGGNPGYSGAFNSPNIRSGQPPTPDPLASLPPPDPSLMDVQSHRKLQISSPQNVNLLPGVYEGGINVTGPGNITMAPGIYYMKGGGFSFSGQGSLTGLGVMIYNAPESNSDVIKITGTGSMVVNISPPTSGVYQGISLFQDRTSDAPLTLAGNGLMNISGTFYAAGATLNVSGNGTLNVIGAQYISNQLKFTGNGAVNIDWQPENVARIRILGLVE